MTEIITPDLCVIGAGSAGLSVTAAARALGASVVLIEKGEMGGDCLNTGCVPSKTLIAAGKAAAAGRHGAKFGIRHAAPQIDFAAVNAQIHEVIAAIAPHDGEARFKALGARVLRAAAHFVDPRTVVAGTVTIRARRFVIATGAHPSVPAINGLEKVPFLTNETLFALKTLPRHLIVIGGGPVGLEMAQSFARLGARVSVIETDEPLAGDDPDLVAALVESLRGEGVDLRQGTSITAVRPAEDGIALTLADAAGWQSGLVGSHLLVATGRRPTVDGLELDAANIVYSADGITVDKGLRTSNRRVFAIGDVTGGQQFTHAATYQAGLVVRAALFGLPVRQKRDILPWCTFTDPQLSGVGLSAAEAEARHGPAVKIMQVDLTATDRGRAEGLAVGQLKLVASRRGRILGATILAPEAGEMISLVALAMARGGRVADLVRFVAPYPTLTEALKRAGLDFYRDRLGSPLLAAWRLLVRLFP